jgi:penicillin-binding protein 2
MMKRAYFFSAVLGSLVMVSSAAMAGSGANTTTTNRKATAHRTHGTVTETTHARKKIASLQHSYRASRARVVTASLHGRHHYYERFTASSFVDNVTSITAGDVTAGEDPVVRQAALDALEGMNGTVVAIDPDSGRILAMVNQKLALSSGAEPCSTIKVSVALAALEEHIITKETPVKLGAHYSVDLTEALAKSNNLYFETLGRQLGFERVRQHAMEFGLGELAGYNIAGEQLGRYPDTVLPEKEGGVGKMCSFGQSVSMTPLQLGAMVAAISNGGTLFYLQHPETPAEVLAFEPKVKRVLDIKPLIPEISTGMEAAVDYGTARSLHTSFKEIPVLGKTGTCSNNGTRYGWFASFANTSSGRIVTVIFLEGGRPTFGPKAAELTGHFYRSLYDHSYFAAKAMPVGDSKIGTSLGVSQ